MPINLCIFYHQLMMIYFIKSFIYANKTFQKSALCVGVPCIFVMYKTKYHAETLSTQIDHKIFK